MGRLSYAISAPNRYAVSAAQACFEAGGNAVDAAVAAVATAAGTEIGITSPLGGAFLTVWPQGRDPETIDGNVAMPGLDPQMRGEGVREVTMGWGGGITVTAGHGSVAVPGMWAGLDLAHQRWGVMPWRDVMESSAAVLRQGFALGRASAVYLGLAGEVLFGWHPPTRGLTHGTDDVVLTHGAPLHNTELADAYDCIATGGAQEVYTGQLAELLVAEMRAGGGRLSAADLAAYRAEVRQPLRMRLGPWDAAVNPGPGVGGPVLTAMLTLAEQRWEATRDDEVTWAAAMLDIQHAVLSYRAHHLDHTDDVVTTGRRLVQLARSGGLEAVREASAPTPVPPGSPNTIHVSVVDGAGTACSVTSSAGYGSGVTVPGTGMMLNNTLGEPELNRRGLHAHPVGQRLSSNMAPTVARSTQGATLAIGSPGADRITTALHSVLTGIGLRGLSLHDAIAAPRAHLTWRGPEAVVEFEDVPHLHEAAARTGFRLAPYPPLDMYFGGVGAAHRRADGTLEAVADPRRDACAQVSTTP